MGRKPPKKSTESAEWIAYAADHGNQTLRNRLIERYLPLADAAANRLIGRLPNRCDGDSVRQEVRLALLKAVESFDPARKKPFAHFAARRLAGAGPDYLRNTDEAPRLARARLAVYEAGVGQLAQRLGRRPSPQEIEDEGLSAPAVPTVVSFSTLIREGDGPPLRLDGQMLVCHYGRRPRCGLAPPETFAEMLRGLDENARTTVYLHYAKGRPLWQIAAMLEVSESRVSQILASARTQLARLGRERLL
jgi:RNA polymerase sigma factor for flagellar operon FliA